MNILIVNGSLGGDRGNTEVLLSNARRHLAPHARLESLVLSENPDVHQIRASLESSDAFVFATGTYWDSWGSPLQRFLEQVTALEGSSVWLGKPAAVLVTMHSVGGKSVLSRLQGVLSTLGCLIPPMSGMVYSLANHLALRSQETAHHDDLWRPEDLEIAMHNLLEAARSGREWKSWPVDHADAGRKWMD